MGIGRTLKGLLKSVAPTVATAVGGPMGGVAMKFLADKFTGGDTGKVEDFLLSANPEQLAQLKLADKEFQTEMRRLDIDLERIYSQDRDSARELSKAKGIWPQVSLSVLFLTVYGLLLWAFFSLDFELNDWQRGQVGILIGVVTTAVVQVVNFWFGSSSGSKEKTQAMAGRSE